VRIALLALAASIATLPAPRGVVAQEPRLYVTNQDDATIAIIDAGTRRLIETLDLQTLGFGPNARPHHAQVEPDGRFWYVTLIGAGKVLKLDRENRLVGSVDLEVPGLIAYTRRRPAGGGGRSMSAVNPPRRIALVRRSDMALLDKYGVPATARCWWTAGFVYVGSLSENPWPASVSGRRDPSSEREARRSLTVAVSADGRWLMTQRKERAAGGYSGHRRSSAAGDGARPFGRSTTTAAVFVTNLDANTVSVVARNAGRWTG
jgi:DNA-binding beta-propeller fold protein YncE